MYFTETTGGDHVFMLKMTGSPCSPLIIGFVFPHLLKEQAVFWAWCVVCEGRNAEADGGWGPSPLQCRAGELGWLPHGNSVRRLKTLFPTV
jgi:hypothetical protein